MSSKILQKIDKAGDIAFLLTAQAEAKKGEVIFMQIPKQSECFRLELQNSMFKSKADFQFKQNVWDKIIFTLSILFKFTFALAKQKTNDFLSNLPFFDIKISLSGYIGAMNGRIYVPKAFMADIRKNFLDKRSKSFYNGRKFWR